MRWKKKLSVFSSLLSDDKDIQAMVTAVKTVTLEVLTKNLLMLTW